jgi:hypothetical protein
MRALHLFLALGILLSLGAASPPRYVSDIPYRPTPPGFGRPGWEERTEEFRRWLAPSVRVTKGGGGSGTICYYDPEGNWAYVISCGHLFASGYKSREQYKKSPDTRKIEVFYHNEKKLDKAEAYEGEVLCHIKQGIYDVSLLRFHPSWPDPWVCPIAPQDYQLIPGKGYHSTGCDGLSETAHYLVTYIKEQGTDPSEIVTKDNNPRGGRSGGGVMTDDYQLIFICSRGNGNAYWTSLHQIHKFLKQEGFQDVLDGRTLANRIPIVDRNGSQGSYPLNYIPFPQP